MNTGALLDGYLSAPYPSPELSPPSASAFCPFNDLKL